MKLNASELMTTAWNMFVLNHLDQTNLDVQDLTNKLTHVMVQKFGQQVPLDCVALPNTPILKRRCKILAEFFIDRCVEYADGKNIKRSMLNRKFKEFKSKNHESVLHLEASLLYTFQNNAVLENNINRFEVINKALNDSRIEMVRQAKLGKINNSGSFYRFVQNLLLDIEIQTNVELVDEVYVRNTLNTQEFEVFCILIDAAVQLGNFELIRFNDEGFTENSIIETDLSVIKNLVDSIKTLIPVKQMESVCHSTSVLEYQTTAKHSSVKMRLTICHDVESAYFGSATLECGFVVKDGTNKPQEFALQDISDLTVAYYTQLETFQGAVFSSGLLTRI